MIKVGLGETDADRLLTQRIYKKTHAQQNDFRPKSAAVKWPRFRIHTASCRQFLIVYRSFPSYHIPDLLPRTLFGAEGSDRKTRTRIPEERKDCYSKQISTTCKARPMRGKLHLIVVEARHPGE